jgi:hypothetical protein
MRLATALAVYAFAACGVPGDAPPVAKGLRRLRTDWRLRRIGGNPRRNGDGISTHFVSLALQALEAGRTSRNGSDGRALSDADARWAKEMAGGSIHAQGEDGCFGYRSPHGGPASTAARSSPSSA